MDKCPSCGSINTTDEHLVKEYSEGMRHCSDRMFGHNQRKVQNEIAQELHTRGITHIPNIFGPIEIVDTW